MNTLCTNLNHGKCRISGLRNMSNTQHIPIHSLQPLRELERLWCREVRRQWLPVGYAGGQEREKGCHFVRGYVYGGDEFAKVLEPLTGGRVGDRGVEGWVEESFRGVTEERGIVYNAWDMLAERVQARV